MPGLRAIGRDESEEEVTRPQNKKCSAVYAIAQLGLRLQCGGDHTGGSHVATHELATGALLTVQWQAATRPPADPRTVLLQLAASICVADHMKDVRDSVAAALRRIGLDLGDWTTLDELGEKLATLGVIVAYLWKEDGNDE